MHRLDLFRLHVVGGDCCPFSPYLRCRGLAPACRGNIRTHGHSILVHHPQAMEDACYQRLRFVGAGCGDRRRKDFSPDELSEGRSLYFQQEDNLSGKVIYRMRIRSASSDRLVFDTENTSTMSYFSIPLFCPGDVQSIYFFVRESQDVWCYYSIVRMSKNSCPLPAVNEASHQPGSGFLPLFGRHSNGQGASHVAITRDSNENLA